MPQVSVIRAVVDFCDCAPLIEQAPGHLRQAGADRGQMAGRQIAFHPDHVVQDFIGLRECR